MADPVDVLRLFISEAAFIAGSKRRQKGYDKTTKRALLHNDVDDTLAMAWSDDSLQVLLAGVQNISGKKTFQAGLLLSDNQKIEVGTDADAFIQYIPGGGGLDHLLIRENSQSVGNAGIILETVHGSSYISVKPSGVETIAAWSNLVTIKSALTAEGRLVTKDEIRLHTDSRVDFFSGYVDMATAQSNQDNVVGISRVSLEPGTNLDNYSFSNLSDGQMLYIINVSSSLGAIIDGGSFGNFTAPSLEMTIAQYDGTLTALVPCGV